MAAVQYTFTAIGLTPGGSSTVHIYCNWVDTRWQQYSTHLHTNSTQNDTIILGKMRAMSRLYELYPGICLTTVEKARKTLSQDSRRVPVGTMNTETTEQSIHNDKMSYIPLLHSYSPFHNSRKKTETIPATIDGSKIADRNETQKPNTKKCSRDIYRAVIAPVITATALFWPGMCSSAQG